MCKEKVIAYKDGWTGHLFELQETIMIVISTGSHEAGDAAASLEIIVLLKPFLLWQNTKLFIHCFRLKV